MLTFLAVASVAIYQIIAISVAVFLVEVVKFALIALAVVFSLFMIVRLVRKAFRRRASVVETVEVVVPVQLVEIKKEPSVQEEGPTCAQCGDPANLKIYRDLVDGKSGKKTRYYLCDHACTVKWVGSLDKPGMYFLRSDQPIQIAMPTGG